MVLRFGDDTVTAVYVGDALADRIYQGVELVWEAVPTPPVVDAFDSAFSYVRWPSSSAGLTTVSGRLRLPCTNAYPTAATAYLLDIRQYAVHIEVATVPAAGNGSTQTIVQLNNGTQQAGFVISAAATLHMETTGQSTTSLVYSNTTHRWLRLLIAGGNLLWQTSPDTTTWTTRRTLAAPAWMLSGGLRMYLSSGYYGTETAPGNAEFDNFNT